MTTSTTAAQRRAILANAHAKYFSSHRAIVDSQAVAKALVDANLIALTDRIVDIMFDNTSLLITIDESFEVLELDAYGNVLRGSV